MKKIYFVRHGESEANANNFYGGQMDVPLTTKGKEQAVLAVEKFDKIEVEKIISSTLLRAKKTAEIIRNKKYPNLEIEKGKELEENNGGKVSGMAKIPGKGGPQVAFEMGEGETEEELILRAKKVIEKIKNLEEENILVVAHNSFISVIFYVLENVKDKNGLDYRKEGSMKNAEIRIKEI